MEAYALNSAGVVGHKTIYDAAGVNRKTADAYERLLKNLMVVDRVPAWSSNRLKRLTRRPKRYLVDPSLVGAILGLDLRTVLTDGDLLGRLLDTFVASQLRAQVAVASTRPRLHHLRDEQGRHEIDVIAELGGGGVVAVETKSSSAPDRADARHLLWLREQLGKRFVRGVILHTGPATYEIGDGIVAAPISTLWARVIRPSTIPRVASPPEGRRREPRQRSIPTSKWREGCSGTQRSHRLIPTVA